MTEKSESNQQKTEPKVWVVVTSKPNQERQARYNLEAQGFEPYLPMKLTMNRKTRQLVALPFFPGYLFARTGLLMSDWGKIWNTRGVAGVLGSHVDGRPVGVREELIDRIRAQEEDGYIKIGLEADGPKFEKGQRVRIEGDLGIEGLFVKRVDRERCELLVSLLGRDSRLTVDLRKLRATGG